MPLSLGATLVGVIGWKSVIRNQVIGNRALEPLDTGVNQMYSTVIPLTNTSLPFSIGPHATPSTSK